MMAPLVLVLGQGQALLPVQGLQQAARVFAALEPQTVAMLVSGRCGCSETASGAWQQRW